MDVGIGVGTAGGGLGARALTLSWGLRIGGVYH